MKVQITFHVNADEVAFILVHNVEQFGVAGWDEDRNDIPPMANISKRLLRHNVRRHLENLGSAGHDEAIGTNVEDEVWDWANEQAAKLFT